ncbi:unnamed protein product [Peniophora sp. CBMAI 1063]|nr:unnamed protein product [Peniophora sp. CBMAI 1063]
MRTPTSSLLERELHIVQREHHIIERELALLEHQRRLEEYERTLAARERASHANPTSTPPLHTPTHNDPSNPVDTGSPAPSSLDSVSLDGTEILDEDDCEEKGCRELALARRELIRAADTDDTDAFMAKFWALYQRESQRKCGRDVGRGRTESARREG